jgi:peptidoglycan lytic transglycosylase
MLAFTISQVFAGEPAVVDSPVAHSSTKGEAALESRVGKASYYGPKRHGRVTASGERMNKNALIAAHPSYPLGTVARVTNLRNGRSVTVRIIDRGPTRRPRRRGVIIDLSLAAARRLGFVTTGHTRVRVDVLRWGEGRH